MLTQEQIDSLFAFCRRHSVRYYDVQVELVDHFANAIEDILKRDSSKSFDQARDEVYKSFGFGGFKTIIQEKIQAVRRNHRREMWNTFKSLFRMPLLVFTLMVLLIEIIAIHILEREQFLIALFTGAAICFFVFIIRVVQIKKRQKESLLANDMMVSPTASLLVLVTQAIAFAMQIFNIYNAVVRMRAEFYEYILWIVFFNLYGIAFILMLIAIRKREMQLQLQYPLAFKEETIMSKL